MRKLSAWFFLAFCAFWIVACANNEAQIKEVLNARGQLLAKMLGAVEKDSSTSGVDEARKIFDAQKGDILKRWDAVKALKPDGKELTMIRDAESFEFTTVMEFQKKHPMAADPNLDKKFVKLIEDFTNTFKI